MARALLFSDVDGTLLDRQGRYAMQASELAPYLDRIIVVLASSRTLRELTLNQRDLGLRSPVVAENGAVVALHWDDTRNMPGACESVDDQRWSVVTLGTSAAVLRETVQRAAAELGVRYIDQADESPDVDRRASVAIRPADGLALSSLASLVSRLRAHGLSVTSGGDWLAVTDGADKGTGARALLALLRDARSLPSIIAAVGDGDNDEPLLRAADHRYVMARDDGTWHADLQAISGVHRVTISGIAGWRDVIRRVSELQEAE